VRTDFDGEQRTLLILGAGGLGQVVAESAQMSGRYTKIAFLDDKPSEEKSRLFNIIGSISDAERFADQFIYAIPAFGNNEKRCETMGQLRTFGYKIPCIIHPTAHISPTATIGEGTIIRPMVGISRDVVIGECCLINMGAMIDHRCVIGRCTHIPMNAVVRNEIEIPPMSEFKAGSVIE
jgi:UDP-N-acetylbacillosamine N-acetyltransferase